MSDSDDNRDLIPSEMLRDFHKVTGKVLKDFLKPIQVKFKRLHPDAVVPTRATEGSAGWDLTAISWNDCGVGNVGCYIRYYTGIAVEIPTGYVGLLFPRSSCYKHSLLLANSVGVIDSDYRGEICLIYRCSSAVIDYMVGRRIGQLVIVPCPAVEMVEVKELSQTERGAGGFGSTGR